MLTERDAIERERAALIARHGEWYFDIPLGHGVRTKEKRSPNTRLRRVAQMIHDLVGKPIKECRILDLGCHEGQFSIELALQGAEVLGIDARKGHIEKADFAKAQLNLDRLTFISDDVRNLSPSTYGRFDVVICSGVLYHLSARDAATLLYVMHALADRLLIVDTLFSPHPDHTVIYRGETYHGSAHHEQIERHGLTAHGNTSSFQFSRPSLMNLFSSAGFSSCYECLAPVLLNEESNRCTFVAVKGHPASIATNPEVNELRERWPEGALAYGSRTVNPNDREARHEVALPSDAEHQRGHLEEELARARSRYDEELAQSARREASWALAARRIERSRTWRVGNFVIRMLRLVTFRSPRSSKGPGELAARIESSLENRERSTSPVKQRPIDPI